MSKSSKSKPGKWIIKEIKVRWYCANCWQRGMCAMNFKDVQTTEPPRLEDLKTVIELSCHNNCTSPNIRMQYDTIN